MTATAVRPSVRFEAATDDRVGCIVIDRPDDAVNAIDARFLDDLSHAVRAARAADDLQGLIVVSDKQGQWVAGADLKIVTIARTRDEVAAASRTLQAVFDELAWLPCTTVAAISGPALGGGLELALACDYRVAADVAAVWLGQPEVYLGLLPAGGGTQRLPRLIGLQRALDLILTGRRLDARRARRAGLLDEVVHPTVLEQAARAWARKPKRALDRPMRLSPSVAGAIELAEQTPQGRKLLYGRARKAVLERTHGHYPAPLAALHAVEVGYERGMAAGLEAESTAFGDLATSETARHLIWLFLATQRQKAVGVGEPRVVDHVGVVGAGFMGAAIAELAASNGMTVRMRDMEPEAIARGLSGMRRSLSRRRGVKSAEVLARVSGTTDYSGFRTADLVIEAVFEDLDVKQRVVHELEQTVAAETVIATNTSALPISQIAAEAQHPERIVGMHFFSPAQRMPLLEVIKPRAAADWALATAVRTGARMGKTVIVVADSPGFYTTRVLGAMLNEAALLLGEGARIEDVDRALTDFGFPVGPFVLYDEVGLAVAAHAGETVTRAFGGRVPASPIVSRLVAAGAVGRRVGRGFYTWHTDRLTRYLRRPSRLPNQLVYRLLDSAARRDIEVRDLQDRLVLLFVNEAIRCLEERVITSPTDGDLGAVLGLGFPPFRGGPFHYADSLGADTLRQRLDDLSQQHGARYAPVQLLVDLARRGDSFHQDKT